MRKVILLSMLIVVKGYCSVESDFKNNKAFIKSLGNQAHKEASRLDMGSIPHSRDTADDFYQKLQNESVNLEALARSQIKDKEVEQQTVAKGKDEHLNEKDAAISKAKEALEVSQNTEENPGRYYDKHQVYCQDGTCSEKKDALSTGFEEEASRLATVSKEAEAVKNTRDKKAKTRVFGGYVQRCRIRPINFIDCCSDKGWGKTLNLANCSTEDKQLGHAKLQYRVHYVGEYCAKRKKVPGGSVCTKRMRTYCVFYTKIARIIREQGTYTQNVFYKGFGSPKYPDCSGFLPKELQFLDLGMVNFKDPIYPFNASNPFGHAGSTEAGISVDINMVDFDKTKVTDKAENKANAGVK